MNGERRMVGWCALLAFVGVWYGLLFEWAAARWFDTDPYDRTVDVFLILSSQFGMIGVVFAVMFCWHGWCWWRLICAARRFRPRSFAGNPDERFGYGAWRGR